MVDQRLDILPDNRGANQKVWYEVFGVGKDPIGCNLPVPQGGRTIVQRFRRYLRVFSRNIMNTQTSEARIMLAMQAIRSSEKSSRRAAARIYNVPAL